MNLQDYKRLLSERTSLQRMLAAIPLEDVLDRSSLQSRLDAVQNELSSVTPPNREPARARLTFRGRPVVGQHGIFADFGTKATSAFADAVTKVAAGIFGRGVQSSATRDESRLLITGTAVGSFGFELEEMPVPGTLDFGEATVAGQSLEITQNILRGTLGSDDDLADSIATAGTRGVKAVREFLEFLATNDAVCGLGVNEKSFQFKDVGEVRRSVERLGDNNLREEPTQISGEFQGFLPKARQFEFKLLNSAEVIRGKVGEDIASPDEINSHLHQAIVIDVIATRVGNGKPRYVLTKLPEWSQAAPQPDPGE